MSQSPGLARGTRAYPGKIHAWDERQRRSGRNRAQPRWGCCHRRLSPRVARAAQPWALRQNAVGVPGERDGAVSSELAVKRASRGGGEVEFLHEQPEALVEIEAHDEDGMMLTPFSPKCGAAASMCRSLV